MNTLFATTAVIEAGAGLALLCLPSAATELLLGAPLEASVSLAVARVGGAALLTLGVAFWLASDDTQSRRQRISRSDGALQPRRSSYLRSRRRPVTAGRHRVVASRGSAACGDDGLMRHEFSQLEAS